MLEDAYANLAIVSCCIIKNSESVGAEMKYDNKAVWSDFR